MGRTISLVNMVAVLERRQAAQVCTVLAKARKLAKASTATHSAYLDAADEVVRAIFALDETLSRLRAERRRGGGLRQKTAAHRISRADGPDR